MMKIVLLLLFLVEVHCQQTYPYVQPFLCTVGNAGDNSDSVVCHTDLSTCCSGSEGSHRGDWCFPNGTVLPFAGRSVPIGLARTAQIAVIRRTTATGPTGIYRCDIPTVAFHDDTDISVRDRVYVGLYTSSGDMLMEM